jgi:predicted hydrolase (HD superfamily)
MSVGKKVRKTLNIDAAKLKRVQRYLGVDTETEAIDRMLEDYDFERTLTDLLKSGRDAFRGYRSPLARRPGK